MMDKSSVHMVMPLGATHGWGVCGHHLTLAMNRLVPVGFITDHIESPESYRRAEDKTLAELALSRNRLEAFLKSDGVYHFNGPLLQAIEGENLKPWFLKGMAPKRVGYTFFEKKRLHKKDVAAARHYFDWIAAGSSWCENILKEAGIKQCNTVLQGVDTQVFHEGLARKQKLQDHFVVFSGGKMELRKGQDVVIRAFKILQEKYDDVLLVNCWHNRWDAAIDSMGMSPYIRFEMPKGGYVTAIRHLLEINGISAEKAVIWEPVSHSKVAEIYRDSDVGLFPNRCEGGTNLVLMEYMACGKPVIASYNTGQKDILSDAHAIMLKNQQPLHVRSVHGLVDTGWCEPNLDEVVSKLEWAYEHRSVLREIGSRGSAFISKLTWDRAAQEFYTLLHEC